MLEKIKSVLLVLFLIIVFAVWIITWPVCWIGAKAEGMLRIE